MSSAESAQQSEAMALLHALLRRAERRQDSSRSVSVGPDYARVKAAEGLDDFLGTLDAAVSKGAVHLEMGKGHRDHIVDRIRIADVDRLANFLGVERYVARARRQVALVRQAIAEIAEATPTEAGRLLSGLCWIDRLLDRCAERWERGDSAWGLGHDDLDRAVERFKLLAALASGKASGLTARTFSSLASGHSKIFERHRGMLCAMIGSVLGIDGEDPDDILARFGLTRFLQPIYMRGPCQIILPGGLRTSKLYGTVAPFVPLQPEWVEHVQSDPEQPARTVLTIENLTSFQRHVREIEQPGCLVVYTGGFPALPVLHLLRRVRTIIPDCRIFHWGDIDVGGLKILSYLEDSIGVQITPHQMTLGLACALGRAPVKPVDPVQLQGVSSSVHHLAEYLLMGGKHLEQEFVDPAPVPA